jgi:hypothetical protein
MAVNINTAVHYDEPCWVWQKATKEPRQKATTDSGQQVASIFVSAQREGRSFSDWKWDLHIISRR